MLLSALGVVTHDGDSNEWMGDHAVVYATPYTHAEGDHPDWVIALLCRGRHSSGQRRSRGSIATLRGAHLVRQ